MRWLKRTSWSASHGLTRLSAEDLNASCLPASQRDNRMERERADASILGGKGIQQPAPSATTDRAD